jgi:hypothetical protein
MKRGENIALSLKAVYGLTEDTMYRFDSIGAFSAYTEEVLDAINWYKKYINNPQMRVINIKERKFYATEES